MQRLPFQEQIVPLVQQWNPNSDHQPLTSRLYGTLGAILNEIAKRIGIDQNAENFEPEQLVAHWYITGAHEPPVVRACRAILRAAAILDNQATLYQPVFPAS